MDPSHVRTRILQDHEVLRRLLIELEGAVDVVQEDESILARVRELAQTVLDELFRHTELEDEILAPVLLEIDAWGEIRAAQLLAHHQSQRAQIRELTGLYGSSLSVPEAARLAQDLIIDLRADMAHEEDELLRPDLLRDDIIAVGNESS